MWIAASSSTDSLRQNIRGMMDSSSSSFLQDMESRNDLSRDGFDQEERDLGRTKQRLGGRGNKRNKYTCGAGGCGNYDFAYIHLEGQYFWDQLNDNSTEVVPVAGPEDRLGQVKNGATLRILESALTGYSTYFNHGDHYPRKQEIVGTLTGSCTLLATFEGNSSFVPTEACLAHCTMCVSYQGCCDYDAHPWEPKPDFGNCTGFGGLVTITGDLVFELQDSAGGLVGFSDGGLVSMEGVGALTGYSGELGPAANGGLGFIEYDAFDDKLG